MAVCGLLQPCDFFLCMREAALEQQAALHQQVERVGLRGQRLVDAAVGLTVLGCRAGVGQALQQVVEQRAFVRGHRHIPLPGG